MIYISIIGYSKFKLRIPRHMLLSKDLISYIDVTFGLMRQDQQNMIFI